MQIEIRPCGPGAAAALALVEQATFLETYAHVLPAGDILAHCAREHDAARYEDWLSQSGAYRFWGAHVVGQGAMVGYVMLSPPDLPVPLQRGDLEVRRIYLLSRFHGGGVGARLLQAAVDAAQALGAPRVLLSVFGENANAIAFYARQGFTQAGVRKFQVGANTYDDLVLTRAF